MNIDQLTDTALEGLTGSLQRFGNTLSHRHKQALHSMLNAFSQMAAGSLRGRWAWGLAPGLGKSRAVIEWATAVHRLQAPVSLIVCASRIEQLCTMKQDMLDNGIPEQSIGLLYSGPQETRERTLKFPATLDNDQRPFLLATHARVKASPTNMQQYHDFHGGPRSLLVWDESLLVSDTELFDARKLLKQFGAWMNVLQVEDGDHTDLKNWLTEWNVILTTQFNDYLPDDLNMLTTPCFTLSYEQKAEYGERFRTESDDVLNEFLKVCDQPMRLLRHGKEAVVSYSVVVPPELKNIMVLDASYAIRKLEKADTTIQNAETLPACGQTPVAFNQLKRYDHVEVYRMAHPGGRRSVVDNAKQMKKILKDVVKLITELPQTEGILVFVYKERHGKDAKKHLERELTAQGVNLKATLPTGQTRLNILTWGQETSLNCFSFCPNVVLVGILHRNRTELETANLGQRDDMRYKATATELDDLCRSERTHLAYQALSRGSSRLTLSGAPTRLGDSQAAPSKCFIIEREEELETELHTVMPGCQFKTWEPVYADAVSHGQLVKGIKTRILTKLRTVQEACVTNRRFKALVLGSSKVCAKAWKRALVEALAENPQWIQRGQRLEQTS